MQFLPNYHSDIASVIKYFLFNEVFVEENTFLTKKGQFQCLRGKMLNFYKAGKFRGGIIFKYPSVYSRLQQTCLQLFGIRTSYILVYVYEQPVHTNHNTLLSVFPSCYFIALDFISWLTFAYKTCREIRQNYIKTGKEYFPIK